MLVKGHAQCLDELHVLLAVNRSGKRLVLPLLLDRCELNVAYVAVRSHIGRRRDQPCQFIASKQRLIEERDTRHTQKRGVRLDRVDERRAGSHSLQSSAVPCVDGH